MGADRLMLQVPPDQERPKKVSLRSGSCLMSQKARAIRSPLRSPGEVISVRAGGALALVHRPVRHLALAAAAGQGRGAGQMLAHYPASEAPS